MAMSERRRQPRQAFSSASRGAATPLAGVLDENTPPQGACDASCQREGHLTEFANVCKCDSACLPAPALPPLHTVFLCPQSRQERHLRGSMEADVWLLQAWPHYRANLKCCFCRLCGSERSEQSHNIPQERSGRAILACHRVSGRAEPHRRLVAGQCACSRLASPLHCLSASTGLRALYQFDMGGRR